MNQNLAKTLKVIYQATEQALEHDIFEPNTPREESEASILNVASCFESPNFIAVTVCDRRYVRETKNDFIDDMRSYFANDPGFIIDGMFEYRLQQPVPMIIFKHKTKEKNQTFAHLFDRSA